MEVGGNLQRHLSVSDCTTATYVLAYYAAPDYTLLSVGIWLYGDDSGLTTAGHKTDTNGKSSLAPLFPHDSISNLI
jgi:hypothetical protein